MRQSNKKELPKEKALFKHLFIKEYPDFGEALLKHFDGDITVARDAAKHDHIEHEGSVEDYLRHKILGADLPECVAYYVNYAALEFEALDEFNVFTVDDEESGVHIFKLKEKQ